MTALMTTLRQIALSRFESFLNDEWPLSPSYFGLMAVGNSHFFPRFKRGLDVGIGTADRALAFIERYRLDPERTMQEARIELALRRSRKKFARARGRTGHAHRVGAAA